MDDGTCAPEYGTVFAYARRKHLSDKDRKTLIKVGRKACFDDSDFELTPHEGRYINQYKPSGSRN
jgi:lipocalin